MMNSSISSLKIKAKLLQKAKRKQGLDFNLKDAYSLIAQAAGYLSWKEMKDDYEKADLLNPPKWSAQWKVWYATKKEAVSHLERSGGYLIPYLDQFFICDSHYINSLGISLDDPDLSRVGPDWSVPKDETAWTRLMQKMREFHKAS